MTTAAPRGVRVARGFLRVVVWQLDRLPGLAMLWMGLVLGMATAVHEYEGAVNQATVYQLVVPGLIVWFFAGRLAGLIERRAGLR